MKNKTNTTLRNLIVLYIAVAVFVYGFSWHRITNPTPGAGPFDNTNRSGGAIVCALFWPFYVSMKWLEPAPPEPPKPEPFSRENQERDIAIDGLKMDLKILQGIVHQHILGFQGDLRELTHQVNLLKLNQPPPTITSNGPPKIIYTLVGPGLTNVAWTNIVSGGAFHWPFTNGSTVQFPRFDSKRFNADKKFGWYSAKAERMFGASTYRTPGGCEVQVTEATSDADYKSNWEDAVPVGEITDWLGRRDSIHWR